MLTGQCISYHLVQIQRQALKLQIKNIVHKIMIWETKALCNCALMMPTTKYSLEEVTPKTASVGRLVSLIISLHIMLQHKLASVVQMLMQIPILLPIMIGKCTSLGQLVVAVVAALLPVEVEVVTLKQALIQLV